MPGTGPYMCSRTLLASSAKKQIPNRAQKRTLSHLPGGPSRHCPSGGWGTEQRIPLRHKVPPYFSPCHSSELEENGPEKVLPTTRKHLIHLPYEMVLFTNKTEALKKVPRVAE